MKRVKWGNLPIKKKLAHHRNTGIAIIVMAVPVYGSISPENEDVPVPYYVAP